MEIQGAVAVVFGVRWIPGGKAEVYYRLWGCSSQGKWSYILERSNISIYSCLYFS